MSSYYTYIVRCSDGTLYTGWTVDYEKRLQSHNAGTGAKYTGARRPVELVYVERCQSKSEAMKREVAIKKLSRREKIHLFSEEMNILKKAEG